MQRNRISSIKGVAVGTVKIRHNSYGKIITDEMMYKIIIKILFKYSGGGKNCWEKCLFTICVAFGFSSLLDNIYGQLTAHFSF